MAVRGGNILRFRLALMHFLIQRKEVRAVVRKLRTFSFMMLCIILSLGFHVHTAFAVTSHARLPLTISQVAHICNRHPNAMRFVWVKGYFVARTVHDGHISSSAGGMGGLYSHKHSAELRSTDTTSFVLVELKNHPVTWISHHWVDMHGRLDCSNTVLPEIAGTLFVDRWASRGSN